MKQEIANTINAKSVHKEFYRQSAQGLIVIDLDYNIKLINPIGEQILGIKKNELVSNSIFKIIPHQLKLQFQNLFSILLNNKQKTNKNKLTSISAFFNEKRKKITIEISISLHTTNSNQKFICLFFTDITSQENIEYKLKEKKEKQLSILEKMGDAYISINNLWQITYINKNTFHLFKAAKITKTYQGKIIWELLPKIKGTLIEKKIKECILSKKTLNFEIKSPYSNDHLEITLSNHQSEISIFIKDITAKKQKETKLKLQSDRFPIAFHSTPISLCITRISNGKFIEVNTSFLKLFDFKREEIIGKTLNEIDLVHRISLADKIKLLKSHFKNEITDSFDIELRQKNGKINHLACSTEKIDLSGHAHILSTIIDLSEKEHAKRLIIKDNQMLENRVQEKTLKLTEALFREKENNELKSKFVSMASHEFRTPLASLLLSLSIIESYTKPEKDEKLNKHFTRIKSSVTNLTELLSNFLSLEKIDKGHLEISTQTFSIKELIEDVAEELKPRLKTGQNINISCVSKKGCTVTQDKNKLYNTLLNLISNASKYSEQNTDIQVDATIENNTITISVADAGIGIPENEQQHVFSIFFRAKNAEYIQGTGLGLNIVKRYMDLMGGKIIFKSSLNIGSVFTINFPSTNTLNTEMEYFTNNNKLLN
jgi:PAS domain S-box-containing protein